MQKQLKKFTKNNRKNKKFSNKYVNLDSFKKTLSALKISGRPFIRKFLGIDRKAFLTLHVYPNNIFCTYKVLENNKFYIQSSGSSGKYKIDISKKTLKHKLKYVVVSFFNELKQKKLSLNNCIVKLIAPVRLKKMIIKLMISELKNKNFLIQTEAKKVFNGCRAKKKLRKKRKKLKLFK